MADKTAGTTTSSQRDDYLELQQKTSRQATYMSEKSTEAANEAKALRDRADMSDDASAKADLVKQSQEMSDRAARYQQAAGQLDKQADLYGKAATGYAGSEEAQKDADRLRGQADDATKRYEDASGRALELRRDYVAANAKSDQVAKDLDETQKSLQGSKENLAEAERAGDTVRADEIRKLISQDEERVVTYTNDLRDAKAETTRADAEFRTVQQEVHEAATAVSDTTKQADARQKEATDQALKADAFANDADKNAPDPAVLNEVDDSAPPTPDADASSATTPDDGTQTASATSDGDATTIAADPSGLDDASAAKSDDATTIAADPSGLDDASAAKSDDATTASTPDDAARPASAVAVGSDPSVLDDASAPAAASSDGSAVADTATPTADASPSDPADAQVDLTSSPPDTDTAPPPTSDTDVASDAAAPPADTTDTADLDQQADPEPATVGSSLDADTAASDDSGDLG